MVTPKKIVIFISGPNRSGKDTVASIIQSQLRLRGISAAIKPIAMALKLMVIDILNLFYSSDLTLDRFDRLKNDEVQISELTLIANTSNNLTPKSIAYIVVFILLGLSYAQSFDHKLILIAILLIMALNISPKRVTFRSILFHIGSQMMRKYFGESVHTNALISNCKENVIIIPDMRFTDGVNIVNQYPNYVYYLILVTRGNKKLEHETQQPAISIDNIFVVPNNSTLDCLKEKINNLGICDKVFTEYQQISLGTFLS